MKSYVHLVSVLFIVTIIYGAHLQNSFHFDDSHTIVQNLYVHDARNMLAFFEYPDLSSVLPANRTYRPVLFSSLAVDWWIGNGNIIWFHISTLIWFLVLICLVYLLAQKCAPVWQVSLFAVILFGLNPVAAETVNYVIQRSEIQSSVGVVGGLVLYIYGYRKWYLIPVALGILAKPTVVVFPLLLFFYLVMIDSESPRWAIRRVIPAILCVGVVGGLCAWMTPVSFNPGAYSPWAYRMTQPLVALRFFTKFFIPTGLSADTDHIPLTSIFDAGGIEGCLFVLALIAFIVLTSKRDDLWIIRFGLTWFLVAMIPTSLMAVSEVENDHRMFFPFIGLALAASYALYKVIWWRPMWMTVVIVFTIFCVFSIGTWQRCEVWHTEETLWHDVTLKSPQNGRGLMNYGLTLMSKGDYRGADYYFGRAAFFAPNYYILEINRGIVSASMGRQVESDQHFQRALDLDKDAARIMLQFASSAKFMAEKRKS